VCSSDLDKTTTTVTVAVEPTTDPQNGTVRLRWKLREERPALRLVADEQVPQPPAGELANRLASIAADLACYESVDEVIAAVLDAVRTVAPKTELTAIVTRDRRGILTALGPAQDTVAALNKVQSRTGQGPGMTAIATDAVVHIEDTASDLRWPGFAALAAELGVHSVIAVPLSHPRGPRTALMLFARSVDAFDEDVQRRLVMFAVHAGLALTRVQAEANLRRAIDTRQLIGQSVGILVERRRITPAEAFQSLVSASQDHNIKLHQLARVVTDTGLDPDDIFSV